MARKNSSLAFEEHPSEEQIVKENYQPKLEVFVKSHKGLIKYSVEPKSSETAIRVKGRITVSF